MMQDDYDEAEKAFTMATFDPGAFNQSDNKNVFMKNYGIQKDIPFTFYIMDAQIYA
jgi:hypothetical protein